MRKKPKILNYKMEIDPCADFDKLFIDFVRAHGLEVDIVKVITIKKKKKLDKPSK